MNESYHSDGPDISERRRASLRRGYMAESKPRMYVVVREHPHYGLDIGHVHFARRGMIVSNDGVDSKLVPGCMHVLHEGRAILVPKNGLEPAPEIGEEIIVIYDNDTEQKGTLVGDRVARLDGGQYIVVERYVPARTSEFESRLREFYKEMTFPFHRKSVPARERDRGMAEMMDKAIELYRELDNR